MFFYKNVINLSTKYPLSISKNWFVGFKLLDGLIRDHISWFPLNVLPRKIKTQTKPSLTLKKKSNGSKEKSSFPVVLWKKCVQVPNLKVPVGDFQKAKVECRNNVGPLKPKNAKPTSLVNGQVSRTIYNLVTQIRRTALQNCRPRCRLGDEIRPSTKDSYGAAAVTSQKFYNLEVCQEIVLIR